MLNYTKRAVNEVTFTEVQDFVEAKTGSSYNVRSAEMLHDGHLLVSVTEAPLTDAEREDVEGWINGEHDFDPSAAAMLSYFREKDGSVHIGDYLIRMF